MWLDDGELIALRAAWEKRKHRLPAVPGDGPRLRCPSCGIRMFPRSGELQEDACPLCAGRWLSAAATERLLVDELGLTVATLGAAGAVENGRALSCRECSQT